MEKKLTPLQKAISELEAEKKTAKSFLRNGYKVAIAKLQSLLPLEEQFARELFRAGQLREASFNPLYDDAKAPDFETYFKTTFGSP